MKRIVFLLFVLFMGAGCGNSMRDTYDTAEQEAAVGELLERVLGEKYASLFDVSVTGRKNAEGKDYFALYADGSRIVLEGNNGISAASALKYYLEEECGCQITWCGENLVLPDTLPLPVERVEKSTPYKYRYYLNYCTFNYTMSWWDEERWQREIDFMAMNGINTPLAVTGQNSVWQHVYRKLGFTEEELGKFFSGPAYFNWFWMGNLDGWGGPLPQNFLDRHEALQKFILTQERRLGMTPVLPAFTGHVPPTFSDRFPDVKVRKTHWGNFPEVTILNPDEELFTKIGSMFIEEQTRMYGTNHLYSADTFNENLPPTKDSVYLSQISRKVYSSMAQADDKAVWVMQGWLFHHDKEYWEQPQIDALLTAVPDDKMLILDLWSERFPVWKRTDAYDGKPWLWCMLHNFGQNITLSGNARNVATEPALALKNPAAGRMSGIGLTMEGIEQNPYMYALFLENVWRDTPIDIPQFTNGYLHNRYLRPSEKLVAAWQKMVDSVFENTLTAGGNESIISARPTLCVNPGGTVNCRPHYQNRVLVELWDIMAEEAESLGTSDGFRYDLVDITRQIMANYATVIQQEAALAFQEGNAEVFDDAAARFLALIKDMDRLLSSREEFLLGRWLESAKKMGVNNEERALYEFNARMLLTIWGNRDCTLNDYACRQWAGLLRGFYLPRWERFFRAVRENGYKMNDEEYAHFLEQSKTWEWEWIFGKECYTVKCMEQELEVVRYIYSKYRKALDRTDFLDNGEVPAGKRNKLI